MGGWHKIANQMIAESCWHAAFISVLSTGNMPTLSISEADCLLAKERLHLPLSPPFLPTLQLQHKDVQHLLQQPS